MDFILHNFVVQILLGIGAMVFLITIGDAIRNSAAKSRPKQSKEFEVKLRGDMQKELVAMRQEMESMKSLLLEHSMSLDANVEALKHRMDNAERKLNSLGSPGTELEFAL